MRNEREVTYSTQPRNRSKVTRPFSSLRVGSGDETRQGINIKERGFEDLALSSWRFCNAVLEATEQTSYDAAFYYK